MPSNGEHGLQAQSWCQGTWHTWQPSFREIPHRSSPPNLIKIGNFHCRVVPNSISDDSNYAQRFDPLCEKREPKRSLNIGCGSHCEVVSTCTRNRLEEVKASRVPWDDRVLEPTEDRVERHSKWEAARRTALPHAPGHRKLLPALSCKFNLCGAVAINHTQEPTYELWPLRLLENVKDPGMVDAKICGSKIPQ